MHFEILVEDASGRMALNILVPKIIDSSATYRIKSYKGIGHIPKDLKDPVDASKRILLANLPKLLRGYGKSYPPGYEAVVVLVCDLDRKDLSQFLGELYVVLDSCNPKPEARFCLAIEEGEAWFLGDFPAIKEAFPNAKDEVLSAYVNDSICGTWELLADAVYPGGSKVLTKKAWHAIGAEKTRWALEIGPRMNVEQNASPSFCAFRDELRRLVGYP